MSQLSTVVVKNWIFCVYCVSVLTDCSIVVSGYYGTTALPYQAFGVGDGTWSTNGTDPMTFLGGYNPHDSYGMDGS